ncbi:vWA domain-containing protein [Streptosporangium roseum]|uniref:VWA containing CoxE family protein n=1 Tax=Streptosporangium roseum (strain ATCC 12428 / DSM 43021 / JCM 3005 / KCTC 9067 / NCIMB 10171 / NRRL 2505 / NI 9100) TaxID=479432 RepID=D2ASV1_STRRD|nr:VWA domain-containing protein [Streptosporangium roseum]ACZ90428.1 VWA containing CoxE family protein [Streptosporangium roseum DSM 43021]
MSLLDRHVGFVHALREAGLPVSLAEGLDAARALQVIDLAERESLRAAYASTLVKRPSHRPGFDTLFDLWFPASTTGLYAPRPEDGPDAAGPDLATAAVPELRDRLAELLLGADGMNEFARAMVERFGRQPAGPGRQNWFSYSVLRALSPETLMARLLAEVLGGQERGGLAEKVARQRIGENTRRFEDAVSTDVRRRIAEDSGIERIARSAVRPPLEQLDFLRVTKADLARLRREVQPLARRLAARLTVKHRLGQRGRLDFRRTVRASLSSGGVPLTTFNKPRRPHKPELVILCDTSDSVASFAHFTLLLTYALREQFTKVRAFGFVDTVDEITRFFVPGADVAEAMTRLAKEADMVRFGRTNYGNALERFAERYGDAIGPKTSLLILGDARSNYQPPALETLRRLSREARHAYWLNPEPVSQWDTGDSVATAYGQVVPMYECRNVVQLAAFIEELA